MNLTTAEKKADKDHIYLYPNTRDETRVKLRGAPHRPVNGCKNCPYLKTCHALARRGEPVMCERWALEMVDGRFIKL